MASRTLFAWIFIAVLLAAGIFFTYHILLASNSSSMGDSKVVVLDIQAANDVPEMVAASAKPVREIAMVAMPINHVVEPLQTPEIVGQTEADLKETRQVSETPPTVRFADPEAVDPMEKVVHRESEFGDNLRHPEQTIEITPPMGSMRASVQGATDIASLGGHQGVSYGPELGQNGGEFMQGIFAYDGSDAGGIGYSML